MSKSQMIATLGEKELLLPDLVSRALSASDRVKYLLTLLQSARAAADGDAHVSDLHEDRVAGGVSDLTRDRVVHASARRGDGSYAIPGAARLVDDAFGDLETILAPLQVAGVESFGALAGRLQQLQQTAWPEDDAIAAEAISRLTSGRRGGSDSLHLVVMDAHHDLNQLARSLATESIVGALVYGIKDGDRPLVHAFASGVERTQRLRFDHPGLGTVATRNGDTHDAAHAISLGEPVSMGIASGPIALDVDAAQRVAKQGRAPILIRRVTTTEDLVGMIVAAGLLTATGGRTSHAAVVAREMATPCVVGAAGIEIDLARRRVSIGGREFAEGDQISIDGESGRVFADTVQIDDERPTANLATVASWPATNGAA